MRHDDERGPTFAVEIEEEVEDLPRGCGIEVARGLIGEDEAGLEEERARDRDALLLAAGELPRLVREARGEADR